jgi:hypothetical protein
LARRRERFNGVTGSATLAISILLAGSAMTSGLPARANLLARERRVPWPGTR